MKIYKGHYYFATYQDARAYAIKHGWPSDRINAFDRGWAIQQDVSGPYVGTAATAWLKAYQRGT